LALLLFHLLSAVKQVTARIFGSVRDRRIRINLNMIAALSEFGGSIPQFALVHYIGQAHNC
ncbi:MAG: hypothetical protein NT028_08220, partial [candidate division Zixibacteria bacterium]|nr:hypothetical protein [candidate division Zixibacteria bacterium]